MYSIKLNQAKWVLLLFGVLALPHASAQTLVAYIEAPDAQTSSFAASSGAETETFNSLPLGDQTSPYSSAIGTFQFSSTAQGDIIAADQYGGANGSQYMAFGSQSKTSAPITINLNGNYNYFGFWFSAGDANNGITLYNGSTQYARFSTANILTLLSGTQVTALNGTKYNSSSYFGNPNGTNEDTGEPFAYVEIVSTTGTFNKIVLDNSGTTNTGFESDNDTVYYGSTGVTVPGTDVLVGSLAPVPEPRDTAVVLGVLLFCLVGSQRLVSRWGHSERRIRLMMSS